MSVSSKCNSRIQAGRASVRRVVGKPVSATYAVPGEAACCAAWEGHSGPAGGEWTDRFGVMNMVRHLLVAWLCACTTSAMAPARAEIQVGAASRVITPSPLLPVSGGIGVPKPAKEKRGELTARAIV